MTSHPTKLAALILIGTLLAACNSPSKSSTESRNAAPAPAANKTPAANAAPPGIVVPLAGNEHIGYDAQMNFTGLKLFQSPEDMASSGTPKLRKNNDDIDFSKQTLIVVTVAGQHSNDAWVQITGVRIEGDTLVVDAKADKAAGEGKSFPYASWVVARIDPKLKTKLNMTWVENMPRPEPKNAMTPPMQK